MGNIVLTEESRKALEKFLLQNEPEIACTEFIGWSILEPVFKEVIGRKPEALTERLTLSR